MIAPIQFTLRFRLFSAGLALGLGCTGYAAASDWQGLTDNSPFGASGAANTPAPTNNDLEFRGVVQEADQYFVNLYNPTTKTSQWVPVKGQAPGLQVNSYEEKSARVIVTQNGRQMTLPFKTPKVTLAEAAPAPQTDTPNQQVQGGPPGGPGGPREFMRQLPPDTQALIEEFRRRRAAAAAERQQQQQGQNPQASSTGQTQTQDQPRERRSGGRLRQNP